MRTISRKILLQIALTTLLLPSLQLAAVADVASDRSADLDVFAKDFLEVEGSFSDSNRARAREQLEALREVAPTLSDTQFELALAAIVRLADNGHTRVFVAHWRMTHPQLGVRFLIADDELYVADAIDEYRDLIGMRVLAVEGRDLAALRREWDRYAAGRSGYRDISMYSFLECPIVLHAAGLAPASDLLRIRVVGGTAKTADRVVAVGVTGSWPKPQGIWQHLPDAREVELQRARRIQGNPLYLQEPDAFFRVVELPEDNAVYVQFRANVDFSRTLDMRQATTAAIARIEELQPRAIIVDQRFNLGGDLNNTRDLMQAIPRIVGPEGRVVCIITGRTFSAGIASVGYLKQAGGDRVTLVGRPVGDPLEFWAEGRPVRLPHSGVMIGLTTERHNYQTGCPEADCHGSIQRHPIRVDSLEPDMQPPFSYADVVSGRDPYLEAALTLVRTAGR